VALAAAFGIAVLATPAGISGAVLVLPFQVSVLGTPSPAVTPTNLLYNVVATPGALYRARRQAAADLVADRRKWMGEEPRWPWIYQRAVARAQKEAAVWAECECVDAITHAAGRQRSADGRPAGKIPQLDVTIGIAARQ